MSAADRRRAVGAAGEAAAADHLARAGYELVARNWRCRLGEIDLVAAKEGTLAFVEVRTRTIRSLGTFGEPLESIDARKRARLRRLAEAYLQSGKAAPQRVRFDCIAVVLDRGGRPVSLRHLEGAF